jgi:hypothetical protein
MRRPTIAIFLSIAMLATLTVTAFAIASPGVGAPSERDLPLIVSGQPTLVGSSVWDSNGAVPVAPSAVEMTVAAAPSAPSPSGHTASPARASSSGHISSPAGTSAASGASTAAHDATVTHSSGTKAKKKDSAHAYDDADHEVIAPRLHESDEHKSDEHLD